MKNILFIAFFISILFSCESDGGGEWDVSNSEQKLQVEEPPFSSLEDFLSRFESLENRNFTRINTTTFSNLGDNTEDGETLPISSIKINELEYVFDYVYCDTDIIRNQNDPSTQIDYTYIGTNFNINDTSIPINAQSISISVQDDEIVFIDFSIFDKRGNLNEFYSYHRNISPSSIQFNSTILSIRDLVMRRNFNCKMNLNGFYDCITDDNLYYSDINLQCMFEIER